MCQEAFGQRLIIWWIKRIPTARGGGYPFREKIHVPLNLTHFDRCGWQFEWLPLSVGTVDRLDDNSVQNDHDCPWDKDQEQDIA